MPSPDLYARARAIAAYHCPNASPDALDLVVRRMLERLRSRSHAAQPPTAAESRAMALRAAHAAAAEALAGWVPSSYPPGVAASLADDVRRDEDPRYRASESPTQREARLDRQAARDALTHRRRSSSGAEDSRPTLLPASVSDALQAERAGRTVPALVPEPVRIRTDRRDPAHTHRDAMGRPFAAHRSDGKPATDVRHCATCWAEMVQAPPTSAPARDARRVHIEDLRQRMRSAALSARYAAAVGRA